MTLQEQLNGIETLVDKVRSELLTEINGLETRLSIASNGEIPAGVQNALDRIKLKLEDLDARNPDVTSTPEPNVSTSEAVVGEQQVPEAPVMDGVASPE